MKNSIITLLVLAMAIPGFSQKPRFEYTGRFTPAVNKEKINEARLLSDLSPEFWAYLPLANNERMKLDELCERQKVMGPSGEDYIFPQRNHVYPLEFYNKVVDYVSVEISAACHGKMLAAKSSNEMLTTEQKNILSTADLGTDIGITIKFKFRKQPGNYNELEGKIIEGKAAVTVVPETEAQYPGGFKQLSAYFTGNFIDKVSEKTASEKIQQAIVKFTVNEDGQIVDAKISRTSTDPKIDQLILDATNKMPKWRPAEDAKGTKVKQEVSIPFGGGGC